MSKLKTAFTLHPSMAEPGVIVTAHISASKSRLIRERDFTPSTSPRARIEQAKVQLSVQLAKDILKDLRVELLGIYLEILDQKTMEGVEKSLTKLKNFINSI